MLKFNAFGFPIEVHATFLIILIFIVDSGLSGLAIALWTIAIFISVLLHELGHAVTVRWFGGTVEGIRIYALGGVTIWTERESPIGGWRRFLVAASGSGVGLALGLALYWLVDLGALGTSGQALIRAPWTVELFTADRQQEYLIFFVGAFIWVSVVWGLVNWLPIGGLDGSKMLRVVMVKILGPKGDLNSRIIGVMVAFAAAYWLYQRGSLVGPVILIMFALSDLAAYQRRPPAQTSYPPPDATDRQSSDTSHHEEQE